VINEQQTARRWTCDDANGLSATGLDLSGQLLMVAWLPLPAGLVGAFLAIDCHQTP
jgi:hypothetical protein